MERVLKYKNFISGFSISSWNIYFIILIEGFITISFEILTIRQLIPVVGNSVIVTSLIIGIFLLFLAYGYRKGGEYQQDNKQYLQRNFAYAAIGLGVGLSYFFIELFFAATGSLFHHNLLLSLLCYLLVVTAPIVYWLGQTVPLVLSLYHEESKIGTVSGYILHLSTIGSFLGAVLTTLLLLNFLGAGWTVFIDFIFLVLLSALFFDFQTQIIKAVLFLGFAVIVYMLNVQFEQQHFVKTNNYANYQVLNFSLAPQDDGKILLINNSLSSYIANDNKAFPYILFIRHLLFNDLKLQHKNILVLGAGGFTLSAGDQSENHWTYIDIDNQLPSIVKQGFLARIHGDFIADDARHYLYSTHNVYDVIVSDVYSNRNSIPAQLLTEEYFSGIQKKLVNNGIAIFNIIARPMLNDPYSKTVDNTIRAVFADCMAIPLEYQSQLTNIIYVCRKSKENNQQIYTDNLNRASWDFYRAHV